MSAVQDPPAGLGERIRTEVERAIQRNIKGLEYLASRGPTMGSTPRDLVHQQGTLALYRYRALADEVYRIPVLMVMALTNRGYILDLVPGQSFVEFLLRQGYDVFMIDWNPPQPEDKRLRLEDYTLDFIPDSLRRVQQATGVADVNLVGYCMGGLLAVIYAALHPAGPVRNLAVFTTPIHFPGMKLFHAWADRRYFDVDRLIDATGNAPPEMLFAAFDMLRPADQLTGKLQLLDNLWNDEYVRSYRMVRRWASDMLPVPGEFFRQLTKELMWDNKLARGELKVGGRRVDLAAITVPLLHAVAQHDHIVPYEASQPLVPSVGSTDKQELVVKGGHVSLVGGASAVKRLWPQFDAWLAPRSV